MPYRCAFFAVWLFIGSVLVILFRIIPQVLYYRHIMKAQGKIGSAGWETKQELRKNKHFKRNGFFVGTYSGRSVFIDIESAALVLSPAGGGKTVNFVVRFVRVH